MQRADGASVAVDGTVVGSFDGPGLVILIGITHDDDQALASSLADKIYDLRIFGHEHARVAGVSLAPDVGREVSASDLGLPVLVISQFTLHASTKKGNRPSFLRAARPEEAVPLYEHFLVVLESSLSTPLARGVFGADMNVTLVNNGPVTLVIDSRQRE